MLDTKPKAVILLSGGLDSATVLAIAVEQGFDCYALSFNYHQRHSSELLAAKNIVAAMSVHNHKIIDIDLSAFGGSALTDSNIAVPRQQTKDIPVTYVPARNTVFLSIALAWAEVLKTPHIFIGVNSVDYSGYPDCRPEFIKAFESLANKATKAGVEGEHYQIHTPLIQLSKAEIIKQGLRLQIDYSQTVSCYNADAEGRACGECDSCRFRKLGFKEVGTTDPTRYLL